MKIEEKTALIRLKQAIWEDLMETLPNGFSPRKGLNVAYYNVLECIDELLGEFNDYDKA